MRYPVDPLATPEAEGLLEYLYTVQGQFTLSGQHNQMHHMSEVSEEVQRITGHYPLIWGGEWGFSDERHNSDNVRFRPQLLEEIRRQHDAGRIIVLTYHQASPAIGEPCEFQGGVVANLTDAEWDDIFAPRTAIHKVWSEHVDRLGDALGSLQGHGIPIIFRPYHEMNGSWFWWGGEPERFKALWKLLYERFTGRHGLHNLLWAWNPDKPYPGVEQFYPGHAMVDLLGCDIYPSADRPETYPQEWYDRMADLAEGRPIALSENSALPTAQEYETQPWSYFMGWDSLVLKANSAEELRTRYAIPRVVSER